jgi:hypothetical protein
VTIRAILIFGGFNGRVAGRVQLSRFFKPAIESSISLAASSPLASAAMMRSAAATARSVAAARTSLTAWASA